MGRPSRQVQIVPCIGKQAVNREGRAVGRNAKAEMDREEEVDIVHPARIGHGAASATPLLRRLEQQLQLAPPGLQQRSQDPRCRQADRRMSVMPAGMHDALGARGEPLRRRGMIACGFRDRQRIDVDTHADRRPGASGVMDRDAAGLALARDRVRAHADPFDVSQEIRAGHHLVAGLLQVLDDRGRGLDLPPAELRIGVKLSPVADQAGLLRFGRLAQTLREPGREPRVRDL